MGYEFLKQLFEPDHTGGEPKKMGYDELVTAIDGNKNIKLVNIREGGYISREKYDRLVSDAEKYRTELATATERLNQGLSDTTKATDIEALKSAHKAEIEALRAELDSAKKAALVRDYLDNEKFTSRFAKSALIKEMTKNTDIFVTEGQLVGAEKALNSYKEIYADAFQSEQPSPAPVPVPKGPMPYFTTTGQTKAVKPAIPRPVPYGYK